MGDREIAYRYGLRLARSGTNSEKYFAFMVISKKQCIKLLNSCLILRSLVPVTLSKHDPIVSRCHYGQRA